MQGRPCSFPFVYRGINDSVSGSMSRKNKNIEHTVCKHDTYEIDADQDDRNKDEKLNQGGADV